MQYELQLYTWDESKGNLFRGDRVALLDGDQVHVSDGTTPDMMVQISIKNAAGYTYDGWSPMRDIPMALIGECSKDMRMQIEELQQPPTNQSPLTIPETPQLIIPRM